MLVAIDTNDPRPVFRQIVDEIQRCVAVGVLRPGDPLTAVRTLAADLQVNPNTVQHAYRTLEQEGTVEVRRGLGTFVASGPPKESRARQQAIARQIAERMLREGLPARPAGERPDDGAPGDRAPRRGRRAQVRAVRKI